MSSPKRSGRKAKPTARFIVTSLTAADGDGGSLYERIYCARGEMENRIKECQMDLFADRTSTATMKANQLRLWFAAMAYVLVNGLRRLALPATDLAKASCGTIRRKLLKIGALVTISVRRIKLAMASGCPCKAVFAVPIAPCAPQSTPAEPRRPQHLTADPTTCANAAACPATLSDRAPSNIRLVLGEMPRPNSPLSLKTTHRKYSQASNLRPYPTGLRNAG